MKREEALAARSAARTDYLTTDLMATGAPGAKQDRLRRTAYARWLLAVRDFRTFCPTLDKQAEAAAAR